ncbi:hypothetical protein [Microbacterium hydrocarbonoxydans]|uniref:Uncharacterized protein n=1 Tax=Microbacterium hydrocarbonoxydans TaxID=273678 RepID=A0A1H4J604_9MICO|nr:hypothetical protein [Microbacterium hydrocarbonoxydans]SEB41750.1 hypothetical protein SAMN04489807_0605 [Microbacterium hydrocarbonoxydans]
MSEPQQPPAQQHPDQPHRTPGQQQQKQQYQGQPQQPPAQQHPDQPHRIPGQQQQNQQYQGQPQHPGQPYLSGQTHSYPGAPAKAPGNGLGRVALILSLASLAIGFLVALAFPVIIRTLQDTYAIGLVSAVGNGLVLVVAIVALILGLMAVRRPGSPILAGIAIGIAATQIAGIVISWVSNLFYAFTF